MRFPYRLPLFATLAAVAIFSELQARPLARRPLTSHSEPNMSLKMTQLTPVLIVDAVEPAIAFWVDRFGFKLTNQVPGPDGKLVFASVAKDGIEVMYQTKASVIADSPNQAPDLVGHSTAIFITVENLNAVETAAKGVPIVKARHKTFYGSEELYVREPGGNTVGFAQFP